MTCYWDLHQNMENYNTKTVFFFFFSEYNEQLQKEVSNESFFVSPACNYTVAVTASNIYSLYPGACTLTYFLFYTLGKKKKKKKWSIYRLTPTQHSS